MWRSATSWRRPRRCPADRRGNHKLAGVHRSSGSTHRSDPGRLALRACPGPRWIAHRPPPRVTPASRTTVWPVSGAAPYLTIRTRAHKADEPALWRADGGLALALRLVSSALPSLRSHGGHLIHLGGGPHVYGACSCRTLVQHERVSESGFRDEGRSDVHSCDGCGYAQPTFVLPLLGCDQVAL